MRPTTKKEVKFITIFSLSSQVILIEIALYTIQR